MPGTFNREGEAKRQEPLRVTAQMLGMNAGDFNREGKAKRS